MNRETKKKILFGIITVIVITFIFGAWFLKRTINYNLMYESFVQKQIDESVKPLKKKIEDLTKQVNRLEEERK